MSDGLVSLGFYVISVKQMTASSRTHPERTTTVNLPLLLITLPRTAKFQDTFRLPNLCNIAIRVEAYKAHNDLTQCCNFQQFGHVRANCKQPSVFCGLGAATCTRSARERGTLLERRHGATTNLRKGRKLTPPIIGAAGTRRRRCSEGICREHPRQQRESCFPGVSFEAALRGVTEQKQRPQARQVAVASPDTMKPRVFVPSHQNEQQATGQSVGASNVNSLPLDNMLRILIVVQQIMTEFNDVSEEAKTLTITKIVLNLMKKNGHYKS
jgi:hypothetical protein